MLFSGLVLAKASGRAERFGCFVLAAQATRGRAVWWFSGLVILLFVSRADARDTGAEGHDKRRRESMSGEEAKGGHEWRRGERSGKGAVATFFSLDL